MGYPSFKLTNNGAEIRRLKKRLEEEQAKAAQAASKTALAQEYDTATEGRVSYEEHPDDNRVRMTFGGKPSAGSNHFRPKTPVKVINTIPVGKFFKHQG